MPRLSAFLFAALLLSAPARLAAEPKSGAADFSDAKKHVKFSAGEGLKLEADFYRFEFGGKTSVAANGTLKNTSGKKLNGAVYVAFFDKDKNLVAAAARTSILLDAGKDLVLANVLEIPADQIDKIASYQVTIFEGEKEIGKK